MLWQADTLLELLKMALNIFGILKNLSVYITLKFKNLYLKKNLQKLFEDFNCKQPKKKKVAEPLPKLSEILSEVIAVYSTKTSIEEIVGALELCKTHALTLHKTKK
jgi:hypothetical protein